MVIGVGAQGSLAGAADDLRVYLSELTVAEILELFNSGVGRKYAALSTGKAASFAMNCDEVDGNGKLVDAVGGLLGTITGDVTLVTGGTPIVPVNAEYYIVKRGSTVIGYTFDSLLSQIILNEDVSALSDGTYLYTLTPVSAYGVSGAVSDSLSLTVASGVYHFNPSADPTLLAAVPAVGGTFDLTWSYAVPLNGYAPTKFCVYYSLNGTDWTKDGEETFAGGRYYYTTTYAATNGVTVYFKVQAANAVFEKTNSTSVTAVADTVGPTVAAPSIAITVA
jgi:hypothetical protein